MDKLDLDSLLNELSYEKIVIIKDKTVGLFAIIIIHDTTFGKGLGGLRWPPRGYPSFKAAFIDCFKLARGMTYKAVFYDLKYGGAKAVILVDPRDFPIFQTSTGLILSEPRKKLLKRFAQELNRLNGDFTTGKDLGITLEDMKYMTKFSEYIGGGNGDPSPYTSWGVVEGVRAYLEEKKISFREITAKVQGAGKTGYYLIKYLKEKGVTKIYVADEIPELAQRCAKEFGAIVVDHEREIYEIPGYLFAPCAVGEVLNDKTIPILNCKLVAGSANNPLFDEFKHDKDLQKRGIDYLPHYTVNAGGLMSIAFKAWMYPKEYITQSIGQKIYRRIKELIKTKKVQPKKTFQDISNAWVERKLSFAKIAKEGQSIF